MDEAGSGSVVHVPFPGGERYVWRYLPPPRWPRPGPEGRLGEGGSKSLGGRVPRDACTMTPPARVPPEALVTLSLRCQGVINRGAARMVGLRQYRAGGRGPEVAQSRQSLSACRSQR